MTETQENASGKLTFFSRNPLTCPVCETGFYREELLTGRGRMIAGNLTDELRRLYEPSKKFGEIYPLVYPVTVCPSCLTAAYPQDFSENPREARENLSRDSERRLESIRPIFPDLDFAEPRNLKEGVASYFLAVMCYEFLPKEFAPTFKRGVSALRAAWLSNDLHRKFPSEHYDYLAKLFYRKARFFYSLAVEYEQNGKETLGGAQNLGPDLDKNYGYDGLLYLSGLLEYKYGPQQDESKRKASLGQAKRTIARIFGMGKASKDKPSPLLEQAREIYAEIAQELKEDVADE